MRRASLARTSEQFSRIMIASIALLLFVALAASGQQPNASELEQFRVMYEWYKLDYLWPDDESKARALQVGQYVPENVAISGVKFYRDRLYLTVPRWRRGVPATLVSISSTPRDKNASPKLEPFPSWAMNELGNCSALQFVQNIEIDKEGKMWVLDTGRVHLMGDIQTKCPPKLVVFDLDRPDSARVFRTYTFGDDVVRRDASYLADLVIDSSDGEYAYISDGGDADPGIIVYSSRQNAAWKVRDPGSMVADRNAGSFAVNELSVDIQQNVSPLALDVSQQLLYYSPLTSRHLFSIPTSVLKDSNTRDAAGSVRDLGEKVGISGAYIMDNRGVLYFSLLNSNGIAKWDSRTPFMSNQVVIAQDKERLQWPASFAFDSTGHLWVTTNRLQNYIANKVKVDEPNYRLIRGLTGTNSYLFTPTTNNDGHGHQDQKATTTTKPGSSAWAATASIWAVAAATLLNGILV